VEASPPAMILGILKTTIVIERFYVTPKLTKSMKLYASGSCRAGKILLVMRLTIVLLLIATFHAGAATYAQEVTLTGKSITLPQLFEAIKTQTGYDFMYASNLLENTRPARSPYRISGVR
jgi:hypothetical protein